MKIIRIESNFFVEDEECIIEIFKDGKWEPVSLDNTPEGWSTKKRAKVFPNAKTAKSSTLLKRLNDADYSFEKKNLRISNN